MSNKLWTTLDLLIIAAVGAIVGLAIMSGVEKECPDYKEELALNIQAMKVCRAAFGCTINYESALAVAKLRKSAQKACSPR